MSRIPCFFPTPRPLLGGAGVRSTLMLVAALLVPMLGGAGPASAQLVRGVVVDATNGTALAGVRLQLLDLGGKVVATTDSDAEDGFRLRPPEGGLYAVTAERLGYLPFRSDALSVTEGDTVTVRVRLGVDAIPLSPLVVLTDTQLGRGRLAEFERRREDPAIGGHFLDAEDIATRPIATPTQLLRTLPSAHLYRIMTEDNRLGLDRNLIYLPGSRGFSLVQGMCLAQVFVNGIAVRQTQDGSFSIDDYLGGVPIAGVELYTRASAAPFEYRGTGECGVVLYWTEDVRSTATTSSPRKIALGVGTILAVLLVGFIG